MRRHVLLIFKEALTNIVRHAGATTVEVEARLAGRALRLRVADDGSGFDPRASHAGNGLRNFRDRAREIGARLDVSSSPGAGTAISVTVPLGRR